MTEILIKPDTRLQRLVGADLPKNIPRRMNQQANAAIEEAMPGILSGIHVRIAELDQLRVGNTALEAEVIQTICETAHEVHSVCGTIGLEIPGGIAKALSTYIEDLQAANMVPRANIIWLHITALKRATEEGYTAPDLIDSLCGLRRKELGVPCPLDCPSAERCESWNPGSA